MEYPANVRIIRLPCTGRIDFNLILKALEIGADAVLISGCHPGDCHYTAGNYHARRRWMLFRELLDAMGIETDDPFHLDFGRRGEEVSAGRQRVTEKTRRSGPYQTYREICQE